MHEVAADPNWEQPSTDMQPEQPDTHCGKTGTVPDSCGWSTTDCLVCRLLPLTISRKVAIVVMIENGGNGSTVAAPIFPVKSWNGITDCARTSLA